MIRSIIFACLLLLSMAAAAHKPSDSYLSLTATEQGLQGQWNIALRDLDYAIGLDDNGDQVITWGELQRHHADIAAYALARLHVQAAGFARMHTLHKLPQGFVEFTGGEFDFYRAVAANSNMIGEGHLLYGAETHFYNGVWQQPEDLDKFNGIIRYAVDHDDWGWSVNGKAYYSNWNATHQIPERAVADGDLDLYGAMDPSDGGNSNRYSLSGNLWRRRGDAAKTEATVYALYRNARKAPSFRAGMNSADTIVP